MSGSTVQWNQSSRPTTYVSATQLQVALTAADLMVGGNAQITVANPAPGGGTSSAMTFTINNPSPQISGAAPGTVTTISGGSTVTISGTGFVPTSNVLWNGVARTTTYVSATQVQIVLLAGDVAAVGAAQIAISNPAPGGGTTTASPLAIVYPTPAVSSLNPTAIPPGTTPVTLQVNGTGFTSSSIVQINGTNRVTTFVNGGLLTVVLSVTDIGTPGTLQIIVITGPPGGGACPPVPLPISTYPVPTIASATPSSIPATSLDTLVTLRGTNFFPTTTVQINGTTVPITGANFTTLLFTVPSGDLTTVGSLSITATNPGSAASNSTAINVVPVPVPTLTNLSATSAAAGGVGFTLTAYGSGFVPSSVIQWNGSARTTTFVNNSQLTATISAQDIQSLGNNTVTVISPTPGGGTSTGLSFTTYLALPANDLAYSPLTQLLYASVPSSGGSTLGNSVVPIDPYTGVIGAPIFVGSEPGKMALSSDGGTMWVGLNGAGAVRQVNLITKAAGIQFSLGGASGVYNPPATAQALAVMPGQPNTVAVAAPVAYIYSSSVTIYDSGIARPNTQTTNLTGCCSGIQGLAFDSTGINLYAAGSGYGLFTVNSSGIASATSLNSNVSSNDLRVDSGRAYLTDGAVLDAKAGTQLGVFSVSSNQNANGSVAPDSSLGRAFVIENSYPLQSTGIYAYDLSSFVQLGFIPVGGVSTISNGPNRIARWGQNGIAFTTGTQLYILQSPLVRDLSGSLADLSVTASGSNVGTTGTNLTYTFTVNNAGPAAATPAVLKDTIPSGATFVSATASQGTCSGGITVACDLGSLNAGSSATVQVTVTPDSAGTIASAALVNAPQGDPNLGNNTSTANTTVTGSTYNFSPAMTSISPSIVAVGASSFTLTVNGSGFSPGSTVQINSAALPTKFVNASQLTASVDASKVSTLGWSWINVSSPSPGGGISASLPLTTYKIISLDVNRMKFDPYTRKLYASVPSTATQVTGNSLVTIDPFSLSVGSPLNVGSEPNRLAQSSEGKYLYIGLDGSKSLTRLDLTSMTQGPVYPLNVTSFGQNTQFAARDLAVDPGNDNLLAIDTGSFSGTGLFDISASTATMRTSATGPYTGSTLNFANSSTLYSYDSDTSGAEFYRWTVTSSGLTLNNNPGYTLNGMGGFSGGYALSNGIVYGFSGGVADPIPTPPTQLGQFLVTSAQGSGQSIEGSGVAPDAALGRVFFLGETLAGTANPVLLSYDINRYVLLGMQQFTGAAQGIDLVRWGRDGLAWHSSSNYAFGNNTPGAGQVFIMRGPFVLPEWSTTNPTPTLTSASPSTVSAGSGNVILTITGSNFVPGVVINWNGAERSTTYIDASHVSVAIPASDVSQSGSANLTANNPGSNNSSTLSFSVN